MELESNADTDPTPETSPNRDSELPPLEDMPEPDESDSESPAFELKEPTSVEPAPESSSRRESVLPPLEDMEEPDESESSGEMESPEPAAETEPEEPSTSRDSETPEQDAAPESEEPTAGRDLESPTPDKEVVFTSDEEFESPIIKDPRPAAAMPPASAIKPALKKDLSTEVLEPAADKPKTERDWEHELAQSKLETEVYRGALVSQIETTKKALHDAHRMSHALVSTKSALEESMATMVVEIETQTEQIKSLKELVALADEELELCHKMLDDRDNRLADAEIELDALERVHSDLMDAREMRISELEKDLIIYKKVYGEMLDEKDLQLAELEEELRALKEMHAQLLEERNKEKQQSALLESVFSKQVDTVIDYEAFEKAEQALEDEYGPVGIEQATRLDLLLTALSSSENEIEDLKKKIEASSMFDSTITMPTATDTGTTADSSMLSDGDEVDSAMVQRLQDRIRELELKNRAQEETIEALQTGDAMKLKKSHAEVLL